MGPCPNSNLIRKIDTAGRPTQRRATAYRASREERGEYRVRSAESVTQLMNVTGYNLDASRSTAPDSASGLLMTVVMVLTGRVFGRKTL
jgi:hypothetical protein